ncbi:MAG: pilus assembly protein TadD, partial [Bacteroidetes bacterium]
MRYVYLLFALALLSLWFCAREPVAEPASSLWRNVYADSIHYVGMATCQSCHSNIHATFIQTGMGRSFGTAHARRSDASFGTHALVYDSLSDLYYFPYLRDSSLFIREFRLDAQGDTVHKRVEQVAYIIGSGHHTNSHLVNFNGYVYQAPITYYTQEARWDMAPGFDEFNERFGRLLTSECLTCHNDYPQLAEGSQNRYNTMPEGISCERCHGPGELHVRDKLAGIIVDTAAGPDYSIVNPRRLPRDLQMDLCQRCHLQGIALLEPGKTFYDFRPGMPLREVFNVYLPRFTNSHEKFIMASQADRLRLSNCYMQSEMSCLTCHNPHQSVQT